MVKTSDINILYVENEPLLCDLFREAVEKRGYVVDTAFTGAEGLALCAEKSYDLVAIDYLLPDMTGIDIARKLIADNPGLPLLMVTGKGSESIAAEALTLGIANYVIKNDESVYLDLIPNSIANLIERTKWRRERLEAQRERDRLLNAIDKSGEGFILFDADDRFVYANQKYRDLYPSEIPDLVAGKTFRDIITRRAHEGLIDEALGREEAWIEERVDEHKSLTPEPEQRTASGKWVRVRDFRTDDGGIFGVRTDVTDLKESQLAAEAANMAKSKFLSAMSHELRTPLNAILGFAQMMELSPDEPLSDIQKDCIGHITRGGRHLLELINEVLDLTRIEAGKLDLSMESLDVARVVDDCLSYVGPMAAERDIAVEVDDSVEKAANVCADKTRLRQALINLLSNATKYNNDGGSITVTCEQAADQMVRIAVSDSGRGIPADELEMIFEPFQRLGTDESEIEGTGIGLTITKQLVEMMEGRIFAESELGKGSVFSLELPKADQTAVDARAGDDVAPPNDAAAIVGGRVLYVEDNIANMKLMEMVIRHMDGITMFSADNAEAGIEIAETQRPDLIILDINMSGTDGYAALEILQKSPNAKDIPVIALSAEAMPKDIKKGIEAGFRQYLTKPIKVEEVMTAIQRFVVS